MDLRDRRELYNGFGDGLARAFEIAITPAVFGALGYGIDRWLGLVPWFTIILLVFALVGMFLRMWFDYDGAMRAHDAASPWGGSGSAAQARR